MKTSCVAWPRDAVLYHHAANRQALYEIFGKLSIQLHDEGIDEAALKKLADETNVVLPAHE